ncbi:Beta-fructofuranosidase [Trema orientale]|uniref:beta-fructofuranosidase n=1 Tax=Trema orientale TaxID=63057 RepID=A0A2P5F597_TREOI|nr:Beta-fructofuranosidase [Trema orientale]
MVDSQPFLSYPSPVDPTSLPTSVGQTDRRRRPIKGLVAVVSGLLMVALFAAIIGSKDDPRGVDHYEGQNDVVGSLSKSRDSAAPETFRPASSRGVSAGVSEKTSRLFSGENSVAFPWNNSMLSWQRTAFHFQPEKNWMNGTFFSFFYYYYFLAFYFFWRVSFFFLFLVLFLKENYLLWSEKVFQLFGKLENKVRTYV